MVRALVCAAIVLPGTGSSRALDVGSEVCADVEAYASKLGKAERKRREEEARQAAVTKLARRVLTDVLRDLSEPVPTEDTVESLRLRYGVSERLEGGEFRPDGDKNQKRISYCVLRSRYQLTRQDLARLRNRAITDLRQRFAQVETSIAEGDLETSSEALTALEIDVVAEDLGLTAYESAREGTSRPFYVWLIEWGDVVTRGPEFVRAMTSRATKLVDQGRLEEADRYVAAALKADRNAKEARELRETIQIRRNQRADLLNEAEALASTGRFAAARSRLDEARAIGSDDPQPLETVAGTINALYAEYLQYNPPRSVQLYLSLGSLGVDTSEVEQRVEEATGVVAEGSAVVNVGAAGCFRVGRFGLVTLTGSWGLSQDDARVATQDPIELYEIYQFTAGFGYRTRRSERRKVSLQFTVGPVWESVNVNTLVSSPVGSSDSQLAMFARLAAEWPHGAFFVQHGLGFQDTDDTLVGWSNSLQVGAAVVF